MICHGFWALSWIRVRWLSEVQLKSSLSSLPSEGVPGCSIPSSKASAGRTALWLPTWYSGASTAPSSRGHWFVLWHFQWCDWSISTELMWWKKRAGGSCEATGSVCLLCHRTLLPSICWRSTQNSLWAWVLLLSTNLGFSQSLAGKILSACAWQDGRRVYVLLSAYTDNWEINRRLQYQ